ncbi:MAG: hypothetical protein LIP02_04090 [Bacteroidales bacterium]|nr:hypothetical protein [Bacteroidales bacterium]
MTTRQDIFDRAFRAVEAVTGLSRTDLTDPRRDERAAHARRLFANLCRGERVTYDPIAEALNRTRATVIKSLTRLTELSSVYPHVQAQIYKTRAEFNRLSSRNTQ